VASANTVREGRNGDLTMRVVIPSALRRWSGGQEAIELPATPGTPMSVGEVIAILSRDFPGIRQRVLDDRGQLRRHVNVTVDGENVRFANGLDTPVGPGSEVRIFPALSGGTPEE